MEKKVLFKLFVSLAAIWLLIFSFSFRRMDRYTPIIKNESLEIIRDLRALSLFTINVIQEGLDDEILAQDVEKRFRILESRYNKILGELHRARVSKRLKEGLKYIKIAMVNYRLAITNIKADNYQNSKNYLRFVNFYLDIAAKNVEKRG